MRKLAPTWLFDGSGDFQSGIVVIIDRSGRVKAILPREEAGEGVEDIEGVLLPGLINTHCHVELSHLQGAIPPGMGLIDFLSAVPALRNQFTEEYKQDAIRKAISDMEEEGVVAVGDICNTADSLVAKLDSNLQWINFIECIGVLPQVANKRMEHSLQVLAAFRAAAPAHWQQWLVPHAPYSVSQTLMEAIAGRPEAKFISIHNQEDAAENQLFLDGSGPFNRLYRNIGIENYHFPATGTTSLQGYFPWLASVERVLLVHAVHVQPTDIDFLFKSGKKVAWSICARSNQYINSELPPIHALLAYQFPITIGTDSLSSNTSLSMLAEMQLLQHSFRLPLQQLLQWATLNGAEALGLAPTVGQIRVGSQPGFALLSNLEENFEIGNATSLRKFFL